MSVENCCGCGRESTKTGYAIVAVVRGEHGFEAQPVCDNCHREPAHRTTLIKGHFFEKQHAPRAVALAGSATVRG